MGKGVERKNFMKYAFPHKHLGLSHTTGRKAGPPGPYTSFMYPKREHQMMESKSVLLMIKKKITFALQQ